VKAQALAVLAAVLAAGAACRPEALVPVSVDIPGPARFPLGSFTEIIVTDFRDGALWPDLRPGRELRDYLAAELGREFKGTVSCMDLAPGDAPGPPGPSFWKQAGGGRDRAVFLTGSVRVAGRIRKALQVGGAPVDGPFKDEGRALVEQRRWTLDADLFVVSAATGETIHRMSFSETRDSIDLDKPVEVAFFELADAVRSRLFRVLLGRPSAEKRTLLRR
jgi:hypothetical protein